MKRALMAKLVASMLAIAGCASGDRLVTKEKYEIITNGMSYQEVARIIGAPGAEQASSGAADSYTVMYDWKNSDGSNMTAMFQDNKMTMKAQYGLE
jgi:hypothetical protein